MEEETIPLMKAVAYLPGAIGGAAAAMLVLLVISIFHEVGLATAFAVQIIAAFIVSGVVIWKMA
ncbi:hypothetical protein [Shinella sp.]|uniref:hypothetical protein n=1 Tax=Shinella sp. TaxID=1870904 RepID=UPI003F6F9664